MATSFKHVWDEEEDKKSRRWWGCGNAWEEHWRFIMSLLQWKQNNGFIGVQSKYSGIMVESAIFLMIVLQKYPFLHKFLDEESSVMY